MNTSRSASAPNSPAAHLAAAQADAERLFGDGPVPLWTPSSRWRTWAAGGAAALLVAAGAWWWPTDAPQAVMGVAARPARATDPIDGRIALRPAAEATGAAPSLAPRSACDDAGTCRGSTSSPQAAPEPADPDAWALHPEPWRAVDPPSFVGLVNTPQVPDENDTTPGEETSPQDEVTTTVVE